jgi:hypothetical protein
MKHFIKIAEFTDIVSEKFVSLASLDEDQEITQYFKEKVAELKEESRKEIKVVAGKPIAPRADGFLYFTCIMMHAAEASALDDNGNLKKTASGEDVQVGWDVRDNGSWVWKSNDERIMPYKNANCLVPGTSILMADGSRKAIEDVIVGDEVITHKGRAKRVKEVFKHENNSEIYHITTDDTKLSVTSEHPLYSVVNGKELSWNKTEDISSGDFLTSLSSCSDLLDDNILCKNDYTLHRVTNVEVEPYQGFVYNFEVEDDHSYIANGVIVHNSDIFPEAELKKAYKNWVGKPLCLDHKSQSVDMIRGVIVDTVYDDKKKRIIALCALDKINHPDLARKVASGYAASVSMGTAVGRAICTEKGCHRVARVESDFCNHMKMKSAYGEINVDLSPIELSIVVNGADPKAKIRRIIAATEKVSQYVDRGLLDDAGILNNTDLDEVNDIKNEIAEEIKQFELELGNNESLNKNDPYAQRGVGPEMFESTSENTANGNVPQAGSTARYAGEIKDCLNQLKQKFGELDSYINKIASVKGINNKNEDTVMVEKSAYYQGGGGVNEPARGQVKYPKEDAETIRNTQDKQMTGEAPFPDVGPVDALYPGDAEKKRQLQRMAEEKAERAIRRQAAMSKAKESIKQRKEAYYQGGGGANEPTPGKTKYPNDVDANKIRDKEDKQMTGASPFPDVGKVDELYPGDLKKKELLSRASKLSAKFVKSANSDGTDNLEKSRWDVFTKDPTGKSRLILSASVKDLAGNKVATQYHAIATKEYGMKMMEIIKTEGLKAAEVIFKGANEGEAMFEGFGVEDQSGKIKEVMQTYECKKGYEDNFRAPTEDEAKLFVAQGMEAPFGMEFRARKSASVKRAQTAPAMPGGMPGEPVDANPPAAIPATPEAEEPEEAFSTAGESGSPIDQISGIVTELSGLQADLSQAVEALEEEESAESLEGEEMAPVEMAPATASVSVNKMRVTLAKGLKKALKQSTAEVSDMIEELGLIKQVTASGSRESINLIRPLLVDAKKDVVKVKSNAAAMLHSFVRYAEGVEAMEKRAQIAQQPGSPVGPATNIATPSAPAVTPATPATPFGNPDEKEGRKAFDRLIEMMESQKAEGAECSDCDVSNVDVESQDGKTSIKNVSPEDAKKMLGTASTKGKGIMTRADRDVLRAKLAQKGLQFSDVLQKAHPKGGVQGAGSGELGVVENLVEQHNKIMDVATATVKSAAERIQKHVIAGAINPKTDFPELVANGLDAAAVAYWKKFYGESDADSKAYVNELVTEHKQKKEASIKQEYKIKTQRSFELAHAMADRGIITKEASSINSQVDKILNYTDAEFNNLKELVGKISPKTASSIPEVGIYESGLTATASYVEPPRRDEVTSQQAQFEACFAGRRY